MSTKKIICSNCGAPISNYANSDFVHCSYCETDIAVKPEAELADLVKEKRPHDFPDPQPPELKSSLQSDHPVAKQFQSRAQNLARGGIGWLVNMIISRTIGACLPYLVVGLLVIAALIALIVWLIMR